MNSNHNNGNNQQPPINHDDHDLDADLKQLDQVYRSDEPEGPPDLLDQAILNKAKRAVEPGNGWLDFGWVHGATTVALIVLTFSIITLQRQSGEFAPDFTAPTSQAPSPIFDISDQATRIEPESRLPNKDTEQLGSEPSEPGASVSGQTTMSKDDTAGLRMNNRSIESLKEEAQAESPYRGQDSLERQLNQPATSPSAKRAPESDSLNTPSAAAIHSATDDTAISESEFIQNEELQREKKQRVESEQLDSRGTVEASPVPELAPAIDQQQILLAEILALKDAGDANWITALEEFKALFPDYVLPDELRVED